MPAPSADAGGSTAPSATRLAQATGALATAATARMDERLPWFRGLGADERAWVGLVAQAGVRSFVEWLTDPAHAPVVTADVFGTAPRDLARAITLAQTVEMVRCTVEVVEEHLPGLVAAEDAAGLRESVLVYSREVAFAAAEIYARAAEQRGAWDARLEALVLDSLLREEGDPALAGRAAALGWSIGRGATVIVGSPPAGDADIAWDGLRRIAGQPDQRVLSGLHGEVLIVIAGDAPDPTAAAERLVARFGPGPVVVGPPAADLAGASRSAAEALAAHAVARAWPRAPRPVHARELLPERVLAGESGAAARLVAEALTPLGHDASLRETLATYLELTGSIEGTARALFVHSNTVRYRLRRIEELTRRSATDPRDALALRLALMLGRLAPATLADESGPLPPL